MAAVRVASWYDAAGRAEHLLLEAADTVQRGGLSISPGDARVVIGDLRAADQALAALPGPDDPLIRVGRQVGLSRQIDAAMTLTAAVRALTTRWPAVETLLDGYVEARDGGTGVQRAAALARYASAARAPTGQVAAGISEARALIRAVPEAGLDVRLERIRTTLERHLDEASSMLLAADLVEEVLPALAGVGGQRRYLVLALDTAEVRPIGGLIAALSTPTFRDGLLVDHEFRDVLDVDRADQATYVQPPEPLAGHLLGSLPWQVADAGWSPDFAESAGIVRRLYAIETGDAAFDGTIAFTPAFVDRLLEITGPVEVAGITISSGEAYAASLYQAEVLNRGPDRKRFLADLESAIMGRLLALPIARYPALLDAVTASLGALDLQVAFDDPNVQRRVVELGFTHAFAFPEDGDHLSIVEANVAPVSKLDVLLSADHDLDVQLQPDGSALEELTTTYHNAFGPNLPPLLEPVRPAFGTGRMGIYVRQYVPSAARLVALSSDGVPTLSGPEAITHEFDSLVIGSYQLVPPGTVHLQVRYVVPRVVAEGPLLAGEPATDAAAWSRRIQTYRLAFVRQAGRGADGLTVRVSVPPGRVVVAASEGGVIDGSTVTFRTTTARDQTFWVRFAGGPG